MARSLNEVRLIGNTGDAPSISHTASGQTVARISLATSVKRNDRDDNPIERTEWHRVVAFGKLAEIVEKYVGKGAKLYIAGEIRYSKYTDKDGIERHGTDIVANEMIMLDGRRSDGRDDDRHHDDRQHQHPQQSQQRQHGNGGRQSQRRNEEPAYQPNVHEVPF